MGAPKRQVPDGESLPVSKKSRRSASKRKRTPDHSAPVTNVSDWIDYGRLDTHVCIARHKDNSSWRAVRKVVKIEVDDDGRRLPHKELVMLRALQEIKCDRIVQLECFQHDTPQLNQTTLVYPYHEQGDLAHWRKENFEMKNHKAVAESHVWRQVQMAQAVAFIHGKMGPGRHSIIHRDIKPKNILVRDNGTTYPSFVLHDFGCATFFREERLRDESYCGTFEYQPPEAPCIITYEADIWSLGACVHYMCLGMAPTKSVTDFKAAQLLKNNGKHPRQALDNYSEPGQYYRAKVARWVTPINLTPKEQQARGTRTVSSQGYNHKYSDGLNKWLRKTCHKQVVHRATHADLLRVMVPYARDMIRQYAGEGGLADLDCFGF